MDSAILEKLKDKNIRLTPQRIAICDLIFDNDHHPSAEDIYNTIKVTFPTISLATVYKTFALLKSENLVSEIPVGAFSRFDANKEIHINVICPNCNKITDLESDSVRDFYKVIEKEIGGNIIDQQFNIFKKCQFCSGKSTSEVELA